MMQALDSLKNYLLIAMPSLKAPYFERAVVYICDHSESGAMGVVINKPMALTLGDMFQHLEIPCLNQEIAKCAVLIGGPVSPEQGFILYRNEKEALNGQKEQINLTSTKEMLKKVASSQVSKDVIVTLGYAGWSAGQLEKELLNNDWLLCPAESSLIFTSPINERWRIAGALIGVDFDRLSLEAGHA